METQYFIVGTETIGFQLIRSADHQIVATGLTRAAIDAALRLMVGG